MITNIIEPKTEEISKKLLELKEYLDNFNSSVKKDATIDVKKCTKRCIEIIDIAGELNGLFGKG